MISMERRRMMLFSSSADAGTHSTTARAATISSVEAVAATMFMAGAGRDTAVGFDDVNSYVHLGPGADTAIG
jgi:hypothetical protein